MNFKMRFINIYSSVIMGPVGENDKELRFMSNWQRHVVYCGWMTRGWPRCRVDGASVGSGWLAVGAFFVVPSQATRTGMICQQRKKYLVEGSGW